MLIIFNTSFMLNSSSLIQLAAFTLIQADSWSPLLLSSAMVSYRLSLSIASYQCGLIIKYLYRLMAFTAKFLSPLSFNLCLYQRVNFLNFKHHISQSHFLC